MYPPVILTLLVLGSLAVDDQDLSKFLDQNGFTDLTPEFVHQEIEVRQIPRMPDNLLVDLGVRTIGARLRIRSAASQWLQPQVFYCLILLSIIFVPARWG